MEMQHQQERTLIKNLQVALTPTGGLDVKRIDKVGVNLELRKYKDKNGAVNFPELFKIPTDQRIAAMAEKDLGGTIRVITVAITLALETMNLVRPMQAFQILDLAEVIVDSAGENDKPAIEDLMLFLQKLTRGEYPGLYEGIDIPKFMERFNQYRDERWKAGIELRDKKDEEYKSLGNWGEFERNNKPSVTPFDKQMEHYRQKAQIRKDEREESKRYKQ